MAVEHKSNCQLCGYFCGARVWVDENGHVVKIKPDPERYPYDNQIMSKCHRFHANLEILDHPDRINHPIKRIGQRGSGSWQKITWDQAIAEIAARLEEHKALYGAESLSTCISAPHTTYWPMHRFLNLWGSPNNMGIGIVCWNPRIWVSSLTYGWPMEDELDPDITKCVILWGLNPAESDRSLLWKLLNDYSRNGGKIIVIDPRRTETARLTRNWIPIKPGTDGALALSILRIIIEEKLYDQKFVRHWCSGFEKLAERIKDYSPETVAGITGLTSFQIKEIAREYAGSKPASILTGLGIDHSGVNCTQTLRAISILRAVTGNIDIPGGSLMHEPSEFIPETALELSHMLSEKQKAKKLGTGLFKLQRYEGYDLLTRYTMRHNRRLPVRYMTSAHPHLVWQAMITGQPYPIRAMICMASNPLLSQANTKMVHQALNKLDLLVSLEHFMTPTAMISDYVMPITGSFEQPVLQVNGGVTKVAYGGEAAIHPLYDRRTDFDFWCALGKRCGQKEYWPWISMSEALNDIFLPTGQTWAAFCKTGLYAPPPTYQKYIKDGFATPSGKVEIFSNILKTLGYDPLPSYAPAREEKGNYPLRLITGVRKYPYYSSEFRQVNMIRQKYPRPLAEISSATAKELGLKENDEIWIETSRGRIHQTLRIKEMRTDVVSIEYGWWFPEKSRVAPELAGLGESNANLLTTADTDECDPILGQWNFRSLPCRIYKVVDLSKLTVCRAQPRDHEALVAMLYENGMDDAGTEDEYLLAVYNNEIAGCIRLENVNNTAMIRPLLIAKQYRGNRIGTILLNHVIPKDRPTALVARGESVRFYESIGFDDTTWTYIPKEYQAECHDCPDHSECKPRPMIFFPEKNYQSEALG